MEKSRKIAVIVTIALGILLAIGNYAYENRQKLRERLLVYGCHDIYKKSVKKECYDENKWVDCCTGLKECKIKGFGPCTLKNYKGI